MEQTVNFFLSLVLIQDQVTGDYTAAYAQFPEASAQGRTKEEAILLLNEVLPFALEDRTSEFMQYHKGAEITQKPFYTPAFA